MRLDINKRRRSVIGLTSLIDVIFLLLLFFMLSSTFTRYSQLDLGVSAAGTGGGERPKLLVALQEDGQLRLNGRLTDKAELASSIESYVAKGVSYAVVIPKGEAKLQALTSLLERIKRTGLKSVSLAH